MMTVVLFFTPRVLPKMFYQWITIKEATQNIRVSQLRFLCVRKQVASQIDPHLTPLG